MKKNIFKTTLLLSLALAGAKTYGQVGMNVNLQASGSMNISGNSGNDINAVHYLFNDWHKGTVKLLNNTVYNNLDLMYDQTNDRLIFLADNKQPQIFAEPVREFAILSVADSVAKYRSGYPQVGGKKTSGFYNVIVDGKAQLLKSTQWKIVSEVTGSNIYPTKQLSAVDSYYIFADGKLSALKRNKKGIIAILTDQSAALDKYINDNNLNLSKNNDLIALMNYYNGL